MFTSLDHYLICFILQMTSLTFPELQFIIRVDLHLNLLYWPFHFCLAPTTVSCFYDLHYGFFMKPLVLFNTNLVPTLHLPNCWAWSEWACFDKQVCFSVETFSSLFHISLQKYKYTAKIKEFYNKTHVTTIKFIILLFYYRCLIAYLSTHPFIYR